MFVKQFTKTCCHAYNVYIRQLFKEKEKKMMTHVKSKAYYSRSILLPFLVPTWVEVNFRLYMYAKFMTNRSYLNIFYY